MKTSKINLAVILLSLAISVSTAYALDDSVIVKGIKQISFDEVGILKSGNGGLANDIWVSSKKDFIIKLLSAIPEKTKSDVSKTLINKLLLTSAIPPEGESEESLILTRLKLLALNKNSEDIAKIIKLIPEDKVTDEMRNVQLSSLFLTENNNEACKIVDKKNETDIEIFWRESLVVCKAFEGKNNEVDFSLKLLKEDSKDPSDEFKNMVNAILQKKKASTEKWNNLLKQKFLQLPKVENSPTDVSRIDNAVFPRSKTIEWLEKNKGLNQPEKQNAIANFYQTIDAVTGDVSEDEWKNFIIFSIAEKTTPPNAATSQMLDFALAGGKKGEVILLIILAIGKNDASSLPHEILIKSIRSLKAIGLGEEAVTLAKEGLFGSNK